MPQETVVVRAALYSVEAPGVGSSARTIDDLHRLLEDVNGVWAQASIRFEPEIVASLMVPGYVVEGLKRNPDTLFESVHADAMRAERLDVTGFAVPFLGRALPTFQVSLPGLLPQPRPIEPMSGRADPAGSGMFVLSDDTGPLADWRVASHKIGHLLGLPHPDTRSMLMAQGERGSALSADEREQARATALRFAERSP